MPAGALRTPADLLASPQFASRGALRQVDIDGRRPQVVSRPVPPVSRRAGDARSRPADDTRSEGAGSRAHSCRPAGRSAPGRLRRRRGEARGAGRPDSYRTRGPYIDGHADKDFTAYFALDEPLQAEPGRRPVPARGCEGATQPGRRPDRELRAEPGGPLRDRLGPGGADHPGLLAISSSGYGHTGPWSHYRAYAYNLHTSSGLQDLTRGSAGQPVHVEMAWADVMTGFALATLVAAWAVGSDRTTGASADIAMSELVAARLCEFVAAADLGLDSWSGPGSVRQAPYAPHGVYRSADNRWVAVSVCTDAEWAALRERLGDPESLGRPDWLTAAGRAADQARLDAELEAAVSRHQADELVARISQAVPAAVACPPEELVADDRRLDPVYLPEVDHPAWVSAGCSDWRGHLPDAGPSPDRTPATRQRADCREFLGSGTH